jgi:type IV pilus assembly protein PilY1
MKSNNTIPSEPLASERWSRRLARTLCPVIVAITTIQPMAYAAPSPSLLLQEPRFLDVAVPPNVMFMMDDSDSMNDTRLPLPPSIQLPQATLDNLLNPATNTTIGRRATGWSGSTFSTTAISIPAVSWINEFAHRTNLLNPLYYNPAVRYRPWNDNRRIEQNSNTGFPDSDTAINTYADGFREGKTRHDMRYSGPNYTSNRLTTAIGGNPVYPTVSGSSASLVFGAPNRPANQGFAVENSSGRNGDIFSSPQVYVTNLVNVCTGGDFAQPGEPLKTEARPSTGRPNFAISTVTRPNFAINTVARPSTPDMYETRTSTVIDSIARPGIDANITTRPNQPYSIGDRPNTLINTEPRPSAARGTQAQPIVYYYEEGDCGNIVGPRAGPPPTPGVGLAGFCSLGGEGNTRPINPPTWVYGACPVGESNGMGLCLLACAAGWTGVGTTCWNDTCTTGGYVLNGTPTTATTCKQACAGNEIDGRCYTACTGAQSQMVGAPASATKCQTPCPGNIIGGVCYLACSGGQVLTGPATTATTCSAPCAGQLIGSICYGNCTPPYVNNGTQCTRSCAGDIGGGGTLCYTTCPSAGNGWTPDPDNPTQCVSPCTGGNRIGGKCYTACLPPESELVGGNPATSTQCRTPCSGVGGNVIGGACYTACTGGTTQLVPNNPATATQCQTPCSSPNYQSGSTCYQACASGTLLAASDTTCALDCSGSFPNVVQGNPYLCTEACAGNLVGNICYACPAGTVTYNSPATRCCPSANWVLQGTGCPSGQTCPTANSWYRNLNLPSAARYYVWQPTTAIPSPTSSDLVNSVNYVLVEINRDRQHTYPKGPNREDCAGTECTWAEEAQNFANWYTYYRTRLFSAIGVTAQSLSNLTGSSSRDQIRLGYGSINYFPRGRNPYTANDRYGNSLPVDGTDAHGGHIVRGVRPFTEIVPPPSPGGSDPRQQVFDWLFSLRGTGATPNREALDAVGRYFSRDDDRGPWIRPNAQRFSGGAVPADGWSSNEDPSQQHVSCRRNYVMLITDGEWTRNPQPVDANQPPQPLVEVPNFPGRTPTPLNALSTTGPTHSGSGSPTPYTYVPANEPQFSTRSTPSVGPIDGTLTDIALFWWSRDLRGATDPVTGAARTTALDNSLKPIAATASSQGNPAFWQHLVPFIIGYGISATMDTAATRSAIIDSALNPGSPTAVTWPAVRLENRTGWPSPVETNTIVTDQNVWDTTTRQPCLYNSTTNPSGCGRVNDTMRAALAARGNFLTAADVSLLAQSIANAFSAISEQTGSASSVGGRSATFQSNDRLFLANFTTNRWSGRVESFDASAWYTAAANNTAPPTSAPGRVVSSFPAWNSRNVFTATALTTGLAFPVNDLTGLTAAQQTALQSDATIVRWLRGDPATEAQNGGTMRNRASGELMADIINSTPLFSKATDFGYTPARKPNGAFGSSGSSYRDFVTAKKNVRPATILVGANGGMLHAFDASGAPNSVGYMQESFAYVPRAMYPALRDLTSPGYVHRYFVDGQVTEGDIWDSSNGWRNTVVVTSGAGPQSIVALDVTQMNSAGTAAQAFSASNVLWDIDPANSTDTNRVHVGNIMAPGVIASIPGAAHQNQWYYLVGNGYESANDKARLLAINMATGAIDYALGPALVDDLGGTDPNNATRANRPNGLGAITPVYDASRNVVAVYAGDRLGRLFKFDLKNGLASATTTLLFDTDDSTQGDLGSQPISAAPRVMSHPLGGRFIAFGTGRLTERNDAADTAVQAVYGIREEDVNSPTRVTWSQMYGNAGGGLSLTEQTVTVGPGKTRTFRILNNTETQIWKTYRGWFFDLRVGGLNTGERVLVTPIENLGFVNITSYEPVAGGNPCLGGGRSFFYRLDIAGTFTRSPFAETGDVTNLSNTIDRRTVVGVDVPPVIGAPTLLTGGSQPFSGTPGTGLDSSTLKGLSRQRATSTDPCAAMRLAGSSTLNQTVAGIPLTCAVPAMRVWRDLPRTPSPW